MSEILNQEEIDQLLTMISTGEIDDEEITQTGDQRRIKIYDFKRPDKFSIDNFRALSIIHESFAQLISVELSKKYNINIHFYISAIDNISYEEFKGSIQEKIFIAQINIEELKNKILIKIDQSICFSFLDILSGVKNENIIQKSKELNYKDLSKMDIIFNNILESLKISWSKYIQFTPKMELIELRTQNLLILPPHDVGCSLVFNVKVGKIEGNIIFFIPYETLFPIIDLLSLKKLYEIEFKSKRKHEIKKINISKVKFKNEIILKAGNITIKEYKNLKKGSMIPVVLNDFELRNYNTLIKKLQLNNNNKTKFDFTKY